jgi:Zn-dependent peptidase ImmA (M78 family)
MRYLSKQDIEQISKRVIRAYEKQPKAPKGTLRWVEAGVLAKDLLGLKVVYETLSLNHNILGATSFEPLGIRVYDDDGNPDYCFVDGKTLLLDKSLLSKDANEGRHNFTLIHEASHQIYKMLFPAEYTVEVKRRQILYSIPNPYWRRERGPLFWEEWKTNVLASALIIPEDYLRYNMCQIGMPEKVRILDSVYDPSGYARFCELACEMHVSRQALAIRMRGLGLLEQDHLLSPGSFLDIWKSDDEDY